MLSEQYGTLWCPEYAREYLTKRGANYQYDDLLHIAQGQIVLEEEYLLRSTHSTSSPFLFIDTNMHVMKVWSEYVFQQCHPFILDQIVIRNYDAYLLCKPDIPWVEDALREYPEEKIRRQLYHYYKDLLVHQHTPWTEIGGDNQERLEKAMGFVDSLIY